MTTRTHLALLATLGSSLAWCGGTSRAELTKPVASAASAVSCPLPPGQYVDDHIIRVTPLSAARIRRDLIKFLWGQPTLPQVTATATKNVFGNGSFNTAGLSQPLAREITGLAAGLRYLARVDLLTHPVKDASGATVFTAKAWHMIPKESPRHLVKNKVVLVSQGHACSLNDGLGLTDRNHGLKRTIEALLTDGYSVVGLYQPKGQPDDCPMSEGVTGEHQKLMNGVPGGHGMRYFLEPGLAFVNYLVSRSGTDQFSAYKEIATTGLSGGGWWATVYAAIDTRIQHSIPVAGSIPFYVSTKQGRDAEQAECEFYKMAGYPDLYVLAVAGSTPKGAPRHQTQVLNRRDSCCFGERQGVVGGGDWDQAVRTYEANVRTALVPFSAGSFRVDIDEHGLYRTVGHFISQAAIANDILADLNDSRVVISTASTGDQFVRGSNGHLHQRNERGWSDTGIPIVGTPAALKNAVNLYDVFFRGDKNAMKHAHKATAASDWVVETLAAPRSTKINTDPTAISWGPGRWDVAAIGGDYHVYHWSNAFPSIEDRSAAGVVGAVGKVALATSGPNNLDIVFMHVGRSIVDAFFDHGGWHQVSLGGVGSGFPAAVAVPATSKISPGEVRVYVVSIDGHIYQNRRSLGAERFQSWPATPVSTSFFTGTPAVTLTETSSTVYVLQSNRSLGAVTITDGNNIGRFTNLGGSLTASPTAAGESVHARGPSSNLLVQSGAEMRDLGGMFD
jgi:hypothetical protein